MNKTKKRSIQKHRAKGLKFEARRKAAAQEGGGSMQAGGSRNKQAPRPRPAQEQNATLASEATTE